MDAKRPEIVFGDPFFKQSKGSRKLPKNLRFVCAFELDIGIDRIDQAAFLRKTAERDELWITEADGLLMLADITDEYVAREYDGRIVDYGSGCVFAASPIDDELSASLNLLDHLFRAWVGFYWPTKLLAAGIVKEADFNKLVAQIDGELKDNEEKARHNETEIIRVARELGLNPQPTGTRPTYWQASCPHTNHPLYIDSAKNSFGCGWCRRKGGAEELRAFVKERRDRRKNAAPG
jgi:hypothetical protein